MYREVSSSPPPVTDSLFCPWQKKALTFSLNLTRLMRTLSVTPSVSVLTMQFRRLRMWTISAVSRAKYALFGSENPLMILNLLFHVK